MSYVRHILVKNERMITMARLHWIYVAQALFWLAVFGGLGLFFDEMLYKYAGGRLSIYNHYPDILKSIFIPFSPLALIFFAAGLMIFFTLIIKYFDTEIVLTDRRLIYKRGLIRVEIDEVDLEEISAEHVHHGLLGYFLGYGRLHLDCRLVDDVYIPAIRKPLKLIKAIHTAKSKIDFDYSEAKKKNN